MAFVLHRLAHRAIIGRAAAYALRVSSDPREPDLRSGRRRPNWDEYFMLIAIATRERAECLGRHVGAVLVREGRIVATGYNGTPRGFPRCNASEQGCHRCAHREQYPSGSAYDVCICVHAEQNAILQAARLGYSLEGAHCYTTLRPCFGCLKELRQAGAERVVFLNAWVPNGDIARQAYHELLGQLAALGTVIEQLDLDPGVLQLSLGAPPAAAGAAP
jgi:dCMP deaminase